MKFTVEVDLEVSADMYPVLNESASKLDGMLLIPINQALKGYFKDHLKIASIRKIENLEEIE